MKRRWSLPLGSYQLVENVDMDTSGSHARQLWKFSQGKGIFSLSLPPAPGRGLPVSRCLAVLPSDLGRRIEVHHVLQIWRTNILKNTQLPWSLGSGVQCWLSVTHNPKLLFSRLMPLRIQRCIASHALSPGLDRSRRSVAILLSMLEININLQLGRILLVDVFNKRREK